MKGLPKVIATGADLRNCLALVQMGQLAPNGLTQAIAAIEARQYLTLQIHFLNDSGKGVVVMDCAELEQGREVENAELTTITAVERTEPQGTGAENAANNEPTYATVTLSNALQADASALRVKSPRDPFAEMGITEQEFNAIKEVLKSYAIHD